jgi:hypothetical protein
MVELPEYARVIRTLSCGEHEYLSLLPKVKQSPAAGRIGSCSMPFGRLLETARVRIERGKGYVWVDTEAPAIILVDRYYRRGNPLDLYLDLLHELTHLRQLAEGHDLWDERFRYVDRPTEIEGYAVAVGEGRRLGMSELEIMQHVSNPWMTHEDLLALIENVERFLAKPQKESGQN